MEINKTANTADNCIDKIYANYYTGNKNVSSECDYRRIYREMVQQNPFKEIELFYDSLSVLEDIDGLRKYRFEWSRAYIEKYYRMTGKYKISNDYDSELYDNNTDRPTLTDMMFSLEMVYDKKINLIISTLLALLRLSVHIPSRIENDDNEYLEEKKRIAYKDISEAKESILVKEENILDEALQLFRKRRNHEDIDYEYVVYDTQNCTTEYYTRNDSGEGGSMEPIDDSMLPDPDEKTSLSIESQVMLSVIYDTEQVLKKYLIDDDWYNWECERGFNRMSEEIEFICLSADSEDQIKAEIEAVAQKHDGNLSWGFMSFKISVEDIENTKLWKSLYYSGEMLRLISKNEVIKNVVFNDEEDLELICKNQVESILEENPNLSQEQMLIEMERVIIDIDTDLKGWQDEDYETKVVNQASIIADAALSNLISKEMYVAIAELKPQLLKTYNLAWCDKESIHFNLMEDRLQEEMSYSQARIQVSEMVIEHVKSL